LAGGPHPRGVEARLLDDDGHLTLLQHRIPEVHAHERLIGVCGERRVEVLL
jgi:hypothetical protein